MVTVTLNLVYSNGGTRLENVDVCVSYLTVNHEKHLKYKNENLTVNVHNNNGSDVECADDT